MKKKKIIKKLILFIFTLLLFFSATPSIILQASNSHFNKDKKIIRVGWYPLQGFQDGDSLASLNGYSYEFLNNIADCNNWELDFFFASWDECYSAQLRGDIDLLCGVVKTDTRIDEVLFSDRRFGYKSFRLSTNADDSRFSTNDYSVLNEMKIGVVYGSYGTYEVSQFKELENLNFTMVYFSSIDEGVRALKTGEIDLTLDNSFHNDTNESTLVNFPEHPIYITVNKENSQLLEDVNYAMNQIYTQTKDYDVLLNKKYFDDIYIKKLLIFTTEEIDFINSSKPITVYFDSNWSPLSYTDKYGEFQGPIREIFDIISETTGLNFIYKTADTFDIVLTKYRRDDFAILASVENDLLNAKKNGSNLTLPYLSTTRVLLSKKDDYQDISTIAVPYGYYLPYQILHDSRFKIVRYPTVDDCIKAANQGKVDSGMASLSQTSDFLSNPFYKDLEIIMLSQIQSNTAMAIKQNAPKELLSILNKAISSFSKEELNTIVFNHTKQSVNTSLTHFVYAHPWVVIVWIFVFFIFSYFIFDKLRQKKHTKQLELANIKIQKANTAKSDFLGRMSHDMRTPMNAIISMAKFGFDEETNLEFKEYFKHIHASSLYLLSLVDDILNMQKLEFNKINLNPKITHINSLLQTGARVLKEDAVKKNISFHTTFSISEKYNYIVIDALRLNQIIMNVANNAIKYTPKNGNITWSTKIIENTTNTYLFLQIEDNGVGMSYDFQSHLFDRFAQETNSQSAYEGGTGLGLAISKSLVDTMEGNIFCTSELNYGTTFAITLPFSIPSSKDLKTFLEKSKEKSLQRNALVGKNVLICEDVEINAMILKKILTSYKIKSAIAENGKIGVDMATNNSYDLILMDIRMPVMDGLTAATEIRKFDQEVPIVALSANTYDEDIKKSIQAGMNAHLTKPISKEDLYDSLVKLLKPDA